MHGNASLPCPAQVTCNSVESFHARWWLTFSSTCYAFLFFCSVLNWSTVDVRCSINFCCTTKWFSYIYITFHIIFYYGLSQGIEYSSMCYRVGPYYLLKYIIVYICWSQTPNPPPPTPPTLATTNLFLMSWVCFSFVDKFICATF